jgi:hypothetical protein
MGDNEWRRVLRNGLVFPGELFSVSSRTSLRRPKSGYPFVRSPACHGVKLKGTLFSTTKVPEKL